MGTSFIAWLLGETKVDPLPAHYYCSVCRKVEFDLNEKCGIDWFEKKCSCGNDYKKDGFVIDVINMYPFFIKNETGEFNLSGLFCQEHSFYRDPYKPPGHV